MTKIKKMLISALVLATMLICTVPICAGNTIISVDKVVADGESVQLPVRISGNSGICGATVKVRYTNGLILKSVAQGDAMTGLVMTKPGKLNANPVNIVWDGLEADDSDGIIAILTFNVPSVPGEYAVDISYEDGDIVDGNLNPVNVSVTSGSIKVDGNPSVSGTGTITVDKVNARPGDDVKVPISIADNAGICGATLKITYAKGLVLTDITKGSALGSLAMTKPGKLSANPVNIVWDGLESDCTNGVIVTLGFKAPDAVGNYDISVSYEDGDVVDGNLNPVNLATKPGCITVGAYNQIKVTVDGNEVTLSTDKDISGKVFVAYYSSDGHMIAVNGYNADKIITVGSVADAAYAKVMWWDSTVSLRPVCGFRTVDLK